MLFTRRVAKLVVKTVCKFAYKEFLVVICARSIAPKALKGFCWFLFNLMGNNGVLWIAMSFYIIASVDAYWARRYLDHT